MLYSKKVLSINFTISFNSTGFLKSTYMSFESEGSWFEIAIGLSTLGGGGF